MNGLFVSFTEEGTTKFLNDIMFTAREVVKGVLKSGQVSRNRPGHGDKSFN